MNFKINLTRFFHVNEHMMVSTIKYFWYQFIRSMIVKSLRGSDTLWIIKVHLYMIWSAAKASLKTRLKTSKNLTKDLKKASNFQTEMSITHLKNSRFFAEQNTPQHHWKIHRSHLHSLISSKTISGIKWNINHNSYTNWYFEMGIIVEH